MRKPLKEDIYEALHRGIIAGDYHPGDWLRQEEIASRMGVSMTPVREALDVLVAAGLAERVPYRGVRVTRPDSAVVLEAYALRLLLECGAARLAALRITRAEIDVLAGLLDRMGCLTSLAEMSAQRLLNQEFHLAVVAAAGNSLLNRMYSLAANNFPDWMLYEAMFRHPELLEASLEQECREHRALLAGLSGHRPDEAARAAWEHIVNRGRELETHLAIDPQQVRRVEESVQDLLPA